MSLHELIFKQIYRFQNLNDFSFCEIIVFMFRFSFTLKVLFPTLSTTKSLNSNAIILRGIDRDRFRLNPSDIDHQVQRFIDFLSANSS